MNLVQRADSLFSKFARVSRADATGQVACICCGDTGHWSTYDPAHFVGRSCMALRWHLDNVWPCCRTCHESKRHLDSYKASLIKARGEAFVESLISRGKAYQKAPNDAEVEEIIKELTYKLSEYGNQ